MCGICGFVKIGAKVSDEDGIYIKRMNSKLIHRGPDAQDTLLFENVALGFSRLSIIGLEDGMQPLYNEDGSLVLICNGEIFNYIELREVLKSRGHRFKTKTDVEVIIHLYEEYGMEFLTQLNGQFAFALYDKNKGHLYCARDHFGIIPFFYTFIDNEFIFASEIKAILEHPKIKREVDLVGLDQIFTFPGLISPRTMFKNIKSLENGHLLRVDHNGDIKVSEYWDLIFPEGEVRMNGKPEKYYVEQLEAHIESSINLRLRSDVPYGIYLSGGLDSSMIAMKVNQLSPASGRHAFSIDFVDSLHSEAIYQELIARESNFTLNKKTFLYHDITERLRQSIYYSECPIKETYNTASLCLSEAVKAKNIKVILSGEGADEFFAGYVGYRFDKMRAMEIVQNQCDDEEAGFREALWGDRNFYYETNFSDNNKMKRGLYSEALNSIYSELNCLNHFLINKDRLKNRAILNKRSYVDYKIRLVDHLVSDHGDRMALANSVEARYPFLDRNIVEFAAALPTDLKLNDFTEKYILKKMAGSFVPASILEREKFHFIAPGSPYLLQKNIEYINDLLSYDQIKRQGYFNPDVIEILKQKYRQPGFSINAPYESDLLIIVITFGILLDTFFENHTT